MSDRYRNAERYGGVEARAIFLELKLQPGGGERNGALSAPINLIRIPDMRTKG